MDIDQQMLTTFNDDLGLFKKVIIGDESWLYGYDIEIIPRPNKAQQVRLNMKVLLTVFFGCNGKFLSQGRTVNKEYYLAVMHRLSAAIRQKRTELCKNQSWILRHDNAPSHTSMFVREFLAKNKNVIIPQPPYSQDLAPADFFLFRKLKTPIKGKRFGTIEDTKQKSKQELLVIPKNAFQKCFENWKKL